MSLSAFPDPAQLQILLDESACRKVLSRYGPSLDWRDAKGLATTVWPDAIVDYGFFKGSGEEYVRTFIEVERAAIRPFHMMVCDRLEVNGAHAAAESVGIALTIETGSNGAITARQYWGRYLDQLHKRKNEWRISRRQYLVHGVFDVGIRELDLGALQGLPIADNLNIQHPLFRAFGGGKI